MSCELSDAERLHSFGEGMIWYIKPCMLISGAALLALILGPTRGDDELSSTTFDGLSRELPKVHRHAESCERNQTCEAEGGIRHRCISCIQTAEIVRTVGGVAIDQGWKRRPGNEGPRNKSKHCPPLSSALGTRPAGTFLLSQEEGNRQKEALPESGWMSMCRVALRFRRARGAMPLVYVYKFMDALHDELLRLPSSAPFFDPYHLHNQFLSECVRCSSCMNSYLKAWRIRPCA